MDSPWKYTGIHGDQTRAAQIKTFGTVCNCHVENLVVDSQTSKNTDKYKLESLHDT